MKIAIAGYGVEGKASYEYWKSQGHEMVVVSENTNTVSLSAGMESFFGKDVFSRLDEFDLVIRSPGINPSKLPYGDKVWSATNEFFEKCPAPIIGVTGTKGKGTTSSLIASVLRAGGKTVHLVGNIGVPALAELENISADDIVVYELSSFQLWDVKKSPHIAVVLMIEPDHLDVHDDMNDYVQAKANIARYQTPDDLIVFNANNEISRSIADQSVAKRVEYPFDVSSLLTHFQLPGKHNEENASAAVTAVQPYVTDVRTISEGLGDFAGLAHRLNFVDEKNGVKYYDDSIATTPGSAIAALASFEAPKIIILGGHDKGADYTELIESCARTNTTVIAIGSNGDTIERLCKDAVVTAVREVGDMTSIVRRASEIAESGSVVILSPAAASFDMFESYADRGEQFVEAVENL